MSSAIDNPFATSGTEAPGFSTPCRLPKATERVSGTENMIEINGSYGEGGGAILRNALALAAYLGTPLSIVDIRAGRSRPGLAPQHMRAVELVGAMCGARVRGAGLGSREVTFVPGSVSPGRFEVNIGTAGSTTLILQTVMLPCLRQSGEFYFDLTGGTDVPMSPPFDYIARVLLPRMMPSKGVTVSLARRGYYPKGGGRLNVRVVGGSGARRLELLDPGTVMGIRGVSHASTLLADRKVADRQADAARHLLDRLGYPVEIAIEYSESDCPGSGITLWTESAKGPLLSGSALGEQGKPADEVGREAANALLKEMDSGAAVDRHLADQLIPYLALGGGSILTSDVTRHTASAIYVARKLTGTEFEIDGLKITAVQKTVNGNSKQ